MMSLPCQLHPSQGHADATFACLNNASDCGAPRTICTTSCSDRLADRLRVLTKDEDNATSLLSSYSTYKWFVATQNTPQRSPTTMINFATDLFDSVDSDTLPPLVIYGFPRPAPTSRFARADWQLRAGDILPYLAIIPGFTGRGAAVRAFREVKVCHHLSSTQ